jgi:hypothetical protein
MNHPILNFLRPEKDAWFFFVLILFLVLLGLGAMILVERRVTPLIVAEKRIYEEDTKLHAQVPLEYLRRAAGLDTLERFVEALPWILVSFGILGTFIGLGLALHNGGEVLKKTLQASAGTIDGQDLSELFGSLSLKFRTGAYGILGSLLVTTGKLIFDWRVIPRLETAGAELEKRYYKPSSDERNKKLIRPIEEGIEGLATLIRQQRDEFERLKPLELLKEGLNAQTKESARNISESIGKLHQAMEGWQKGVVAAAGAINQDVRGVREVASNVRADADRLREAAERNGQLLGEFIRTLPEVSRTVLLAANSLGRSESALSIGLSNVQGTLDHAFTRLEREADERMRRHGELVDRLGATLTGAEARLLRQGEAHREHVDQVMSLLREPLEQLRIGTERQSAAATGLEAAAREVGEFTGRMPEQFADHAKQMRAAIDGLDTGLRDATRSVHGQLESIGREAIAANQTAAMVRGGLESLNDGLSRLRFALGEFDGVSGAGPTLKSWAERALGEHRELVISAANALDVRLVEGLGDQLQSIERSLAPIKASAVVSQTALEAQAGRLKAIAEGQGRLLQRAEEANAVLREIPENVRGQAADITRVLNQRASELGGSIGELRREVAGLERRLEALDAQDREAKAALGTVGRDVGAVMSQVGGGSETVVGLAGEAIRLLRAVEGRLDAWETEGGSLRGIQAKLGELQADVATGAQVAESAAPVVRALDELRATLGVTPAGVLPRGGGPREQTLRAILHNLEVRFAQLLAAPEGEAPVQVSDLRAALRRTEATIEAVRVSVDALRSSLLDGAAPRQSGEAFDAAGGQGTGLALRGEEGAAPALDSTVAADARSGERSGHEKGSEVIRVRRKTKGGTEGT